MSEETKPKLTPNDPVPTEVLGQFTKLEEARDSIANRLLDLEQDKVRLLAAAHQVDEQRTRLFEKILIERGLDPRTRVGINPTTGALTLLDKPSEKND